MADKKESPSSKTRAKNKYNNKAYDQIHLMVKRGDKEKIQERATKNGESVNSYIRRLISEDMETIF